MEKVRNRPIGLFAAVATYLFAAAAITFAASSPIKIDLVSESRAIAPGETFSVAIRQRMKPGYHTYWRNPGTVGLATSVKWKLPDGFKAGPIQWQAPEMTTMAAYKVWGYEGEALLLVDIKAPKALKAGDKVVIAGEVTWMCCGKQCHPGFKELNVALPVAERTKTNKRMKKAFDRVRSEQPQKMKGWAMECEAKGGAYTLHITPDTPVGGGIRFFDYDRQISSDKPQVLKREGKTFVLKMREEEHTGERLGRLRGVLRLEVNGGRETVLVDSLIARK